MEKQLNSSSLDEEKIHSDSTTCQELNKAKTLSNKTVTGE